MATTCRLATVTGGQVTVATTAQLASRRAEQQEKTTVFLQPEHVCLFFVGNSSWLVFGVTLKTGVASELL